MTAFTGTHFAKIAEIAMDRWGLNLTEKKEQLVSNRLSKFMRKSHFADIDSYLHHLETDANEEDLLVFFDLLSTNVTSFFREIQHFEYLEREFYTALARGNLTLPNKRIRIWSAACSTGPEPYSLAIHAMQYLPDFKSWDFKILATDLSNTAIAEAKQATYPEKMVAEIDKDLVEKHFLKGKGANAGKLKVAKHLRDLVTIRRMNLMEDWPFSGPIDIIFCRNVMIYFDKPTREKLVKRMYDILRPGGILAVGSAETLSGLKTEFDTVQPSVYVK